MPLPVEAKSTPDCKTTMMYPKKLGLALNTAHGFNSVANILADIDTDRIEVSGLKGSVYLPPRWSQVKTCSLLDSLYRGYPAGSLLLWQPHRDFSGGQYHSRPDIRKLLVVDGTYRLSTLYCFMRSPCSKDDMISFRPSDEVFLPVSESIKGDPEYLRNARALWCHEGRVYDFLKQYLGNLRTFREVSEDEERHIAHTFAGVHRMMAYSFPFARLGEAYTEADIAELRARLHAGRE